MRMALAACLMLAAAGAADAQQRQRPPAQPPPPSAQPEPPPEIPLIYEPQLLKLSETLGVIAFMSQLCGEPDIDAWRARAEQLIEAEAATPARKERLAGAYNRGYAGHQPAHRICTDRSRAVIQRKIREAKEIAQDLSNRFGG